MSELEKLLAGILSKLSKEKVTLSVAKELFDKVKTYFQENDVAPGSPKFDSHFTRESVRLAFKILFKFSETTDRFAEKWQKGEVQPKHEELVLLARAGDEILLVLTYFEARHNFVFLGNNYHHQIAKSVQNIRDTEEKFLRQVHQISLDEQDRSKKEFPWLWVVVLMGILIVGLICLVLWLWQRKK